MREIKFRGKNVTNGQWVYGCLVNNLWTYSDLADFPQGTPVCEIITGKYEGDSWDDVVGSDEDAIVTVDPNTVGQYSGLNDAKGVEIYEGDIITLSGKYTYVVRFEEGKFVCYHTIEEYGRWGDLSRMTDLDFKIYQHQVIGNIHEHANHPATGKG